MFEFQFKKVFLFREPVSIPHNHVFRFQPYSHVSKVFQNMCLEDRVYTSVMENATLDVDNLRCPRAEESADAFAIARL